MENIKVSIIVPVYNTSKYLSKCINSLINQTLEEIEIIIVNDGSDENIEKIISKYQDKIIYIHNPHMGIGYTRNTGIRQAMGEYIGFVDSDDYVDLNMFKEYYEFAKENDCDIVVGNYMQVNTNNVKEINVPYFNFNSIAEDPSILTKIDYGPCNKIFKREMILSNKIIFEENLKYEDMPFVSKALCKARKIGHLNKAFYFYNVRAGSETNNFVMINFDIFEIMNIYISLFQKKYPMETEFVVTSKILDYNIQQRNNSNKKMRDEFIDKTFEFIKEHFIKYTNNHYFINDNMLKKIIKQSKFLTKIYCNCYSIIHKNMIK